MKNSHNIRHLRAFLAVSKCKSISKATEQVFLSQPAITQAISKLELSFDSVFFERKSDGMYLTASGSMLAERVERALDILKGGIKDALRVGAGEASNNAAQLLNIVTTTQLTALIAVVEARSFSLAGRNIGISQSSLHRSAKDLEGLLGIVLFEKTSIGISPTKASLYLSKAAKFVFSEIEQAREEISCLNNREIGHMVIGSMPLARTSVLPSTIIQFCDLYPDFKISINDGPYSDQLFHLRHADIDLLIGALRFPAPSDDIIQHELFSSEVVIVARPDHPFHNEPTLNVDMLRRASWVVPRSGTPTRSIFEGLFTSEEQELPDRIVECSSQILIRSLLEGSDRLTVISEHQVQKELADGVLKVVSYNMAQACRPIGITMRKGWKPTATQQQFIEILQEKSQQLAEKEF